jgi:DNA ligase-1
MNKIYEILQEINNENSTNKKVEILNKYKDNELLKKVFYYTYNKMYNFYIKKLPKVSTHKGELTIEDEEVWNLLDSLRNREITGNAARDAVEYMLNKFDEKDAQIFEKILKKDMKIKVNTKLINRVWPNLIPEIPYMGARAFNQKDFNKLLKQTDHLFAEVKYDGEFVNIINENGNIKTLSRGGKDIYLEHIFNIDSNWVLTGELLVKGVDRYTSNGIINSLKQINEKIKLGTVTTKELDAFFKRYGKLPEEIEKDIYVVVWDCIPYENWTQGKWEVELYKRRDLLKKFIGGNIHMVEYEIVRTKKEIFEYYHKMLQRGEEGIILKDPSGIWKDGKHIESQKFKNVIDLDLRIVGYKFGNPGTKYEDKINRLILESEDGKLQVTASGVSEEMMDYLTNEKDNLIGKIAVITCNGISQNREGGYSVLHPRIQNVRDDKNEANTLKECLEIEEMAKELNE